LILDWGDGTLVSPINFIGETTNDGSLGVLGDQLLVSFSETVAGILNFEFVSSQVSELVDGILDTTVLSVESLDLVVVVSEDGESSGFFTSSVTLVMVVLPGRPHGGEGFEGGSGSNSSES